MKKLFGMLLVLCLATMMTGFAKDAAKSDKKDSGKEMHLTGIVTDPMCAKSGDKAKMADADCAKKCAQDGKWAFVNDKDGSVWDIENPDAVKGHEGHHVKVSAHVNDGAKSIHVMNVSMAAEKGAKKEKGKS